MPAPPDARPDLMTQAPSLIPLLPLMYVAWADGVLTPSEMERVRQQLDAQDWIDEAEKAVVLAWLTPTAPPTVTQYRRWLRAIRTVAADIPDAERHSLAGLGIAMARQAGGDGDVRWATPEARLALSDVEDALGVVGAEISRELLAERPDAHPPPTGTPPFDVAAMARLLDGRHADLRDKVRTLLRDPVFKHDLTLDTPAYRERVLYWCTLLADQGLGALAYPEAYGGQDDMAQFITVFEMLAYHDLSLVIKFGVQFGLFGGSIQRLGTQRHHQRYLAAIGRLELPGCFAMTELGHGSNVRELETVARFDAATDSFIVHTPHDGAHKEYIGNAALHGRLATVFAQLEIDGEGYGVHAFVVPLRDEAGQILPGIRIADSGLKMGLNGVDNGRIWFDHVRIPRENLLDRFAQVGPEGGYTSPIRSEGRRFFTMLGTLVGGRISVARGALSAAKCGLTIAIRYGNRRRQFGPKGEPEIAILDYQTHQRRLLPLLANAYALHFALEDLTRRFVEQDDTDAEAVEGLASGLKAFSTWNTTHTLQTCREACGGQGYLAVNRFAALKADTDVFTTFEGDNTVLMLQVAKGLLTQYRQSFQDMKFFGLVKYLAQEAGVTLKDLNPITPRLTDEAHLRDPGFQLTLFQQREHDLLRSVARRLKKRIDEGMDSYRAFIECQSHLLLLAQAHTEHVTLDRFVAAVAACQDPALQEALRALCNLFALSHIEKDRGWFQAHGYLESAKSRAVRRQVNRLCAEIRPYAEALVDAFAIPNSSLAAPIALP